MEYVGVEIMYDRDMTTEEKILDRLEKVIELLEDLIKFEKETFGLQSDAWSDENETF
jgi:hypothetical protein